MQLIPVLDLKAGQAVHAVRGERASYAPVQGVLGSGADPVALARAYRDRLGCHTCYVADLDAISGPAENRSSSGSHAAGPGVGTRPAAHKSNHTDLLRTLVGLNLALWVDAGVSSPVQAWALADVGIAQVIVGSETLASPDQLTTLAAAFPPSRLILSVDLHSGVLHAPSGLDSPLKLVALAAQVGLAQVILLDLARVGAATGPPLELLSQVRAHFPYLAFYAGGGVRHRSDLEALAQAGAAGALIATAFHRGGLTSADVLAYP
jgi:phosphoribosylformimino-5-aminoimidazole carboxamide ribotide isomerase